MRKIVVAVIGVVLMAGSTTPVAYAKNRHHVRRERQYANERFLNSNAAARPAPQTDNDAGMGGWASMTGFD